ncbi:proliferating cell nuclear antigen [Tilletia horrida]|uniref:DNA sliding clamp PCNA n=1 Tax=Tilletia horrida TaxID=155126 RepID=A0AAN6JUJ0_9BASI|nr:proliferating cell nuclear antigen [Tilletia horrida]KAK0555240.1 proliferating cell nuclear antigen [Tilletia horrida]KAK0563201.1 proliferating cell nuclear antigen [Tilletia horrida]
MLEARLSEAQLLKKVLDAVRDLITDANFDCNEDGIRLQAMDNSHVALTAIELRAEGFQPYRCDRPMSIGVSLANLTKVVKTGGNDDTLTIRKDDDGDALNLMFEASKSDRVLEYELMLMDIDSEHLGIPDTQYDAVIRMSSSEFSRIVRDLGSLSESVAIDVSKEGVTFAAQGEIGNARLTLKQGSATGSAVKVDDDEDEDQDEDDEEEVKPKARKRKRGESSKSSGGGDGEVPVSIDLQQNVNLTFSLKYLNNFAKAAPLSNAVALHLSSEVPLLVEFSFENGHVRFYLAPKLAEDGDN